MKVTLTGIPETLLIPLWARAVETQRPDPIIRDEKAVEMLNSIDYDFSRFDKTWMSQLGVAVRTMLLDQATLKFIEWHPGAVVINLGAGLDTRFHRLDNGTVRWVDLDLPEVIDLKRQFLQETDRYQLIAKSIFDVHWMDEILPVGNPVLVIAEGLLMYFEEREVREIFNMLPDRFPHSEMLFEMLGPGLVGKGRFHDTISKVGTAEWKWSLKDSRQFEVWNEKIRFIEEWYYTDYFRERWRWFGWITRFTFFKKWLSNRIVHVRFEG